MNLDTYEFYSGQSVTDPLAVEAQIRKTQIILESLLGYTLDSNQRLANHYIELGKTDNCFCPDTQNLEAPDTVQFAYRLFPYNPKDKYLFVDPFTELASVKLVKGDVTVKELTSCKIRPEWKQNGFKWAKFIEKCPQCHCECDCIDCLQIAVDANWLGDCDFTTSVITSPGSITSGVFIPPTPEVVIMQDSFDGSSIDTTKWMTEGSGLGMNINFNALQFVAFSGTASGLLQGLVSNITHELNNTAVYVRFDEMLAPISQTLGLRNGSRFIEVELKFGETVSVIDETGILYQTPYIGNFLHYRIRENNGQLIFEYSGNTLTWTHLYTTTIDISGFWSAYITDKTYDVTTLPSQANYVNDFKWVILEIPGTTSPPIVIPPTFGTITTDGNCLPQDLLIVWTDLIQNGLDCNNNVQSERIGQHQYQKYDRVDAGGTGLNLTNVQLSILQKWAGPNGTLSEEFIR